jgi:3-oxoadipate enol-lactonase
MWDLQSQVLRKHFRVLRYDTRGQASSVATSGACSIDQFGRDLLQLLDALGIATVSFCGLSMGGMVGMWLGINAPARLTNLILCNTAARIGSAEMWNARIAKVQQDGVASIADAILQRWFTPRFLASAPERVESARQMLLHSPAVGYAGNCAAIRDMDQRKNIYCIRIPTLVIAGAHDSATPPSDAKFLTERITQAQYTELNAAHLSNLEASDAFNSALLQFLNNPEVS